MAWETRNTFTPQEMKQFTTLAHPFAIFIPGKETTMGLAGALHMLCRGDEFIVWDGASWLMPLGIFFRRDEDLRAIIEFLKEWKVNHFLIQPE